MLSHDEREQLAEMEARLAEDDPRLATMLSGAHPSGAAMPTSRTRSLGARIARSMMAVVGAVALTVLVTALAGPDLGGLVGALGLPIAGLYGWRQLGSCSGRR